MKAQTAEKNRLRSLPAMDCLLGMPDMDPFLENLGREAIKTVLGEAMDSLRKRYSPAKMWNLQLNQF